MFIGNKDQIPETSCFLDSLGIFKIILPRFVNGIGGQIGGQEGGQVDRSIIELTPAQNQVFRLIVDNPKMSREELVENLKINESAIQKHINILKEKKVIERLRSA